MEGKEEKNFSDQSAKIRIKDNSVLFEWEAPSHLYRKRGKDFFSTILAIVFLLAIFFIFLRDFLLVLLILAVAFFIYVITTAKPQVIKNQLTKKGVRLDKKFYLWEELVSFWLEYKDQYTIFHLVMPFRLPGRLILLIEKNKEDKVIDILFDKLVYIEEPEKSWVDRFATWVAHKIRLESPELAAHK